MPKNAQAAHKRGAALQRLRSQSINYITKTNFNKSKGHTTEDGIVPANRKVLLEVFGHYIETSFYNKAGDHMCANNFNGYTIQWANNEYIRGP